MLQNESAKIFKRRSLNRSAMIRLRRCLKFLSNFFFGFRSGCFSACAIANERSDDDRLSVPGLHVFATRPAMWIGRGKRGHIAPAVKTSLLYSCEWPRGGFDYYEVIKHNVNHILMMFLLFCSRERKRFLETGFPANSTVCVLSLCVFVEFFIDCEIAAGRGDRSNENGQGEKPAAFVK